MTHQRSTSQHRAPSRTRSRSPTSRPTTPLRPSSRSSLRDSLRNGHSGPSALDALEPQFAELSDSMADLEANFMHLQLMHESLGRFGESFAAFLYGLNMNAFVVDFPEAPLTDSIKRWQRQQRQHAGLDASTLLGGGKAGDGETMMGDTTSISNASLRATPRRKSMAPPTTPGTATTTTTTTMTGNTSKSSIPNARGGAARGARGARGGTRGSGLPRGRGTAGRGVR